MRNTVNILVLVSGNGSNLQALIDAGKRGDLGNGRIAMVLADRAGVYALERAKSANLPSFIEAPDKTLPMESRRRDLSDRVLYFCRSQDIGLIVLAGFLSILAGTIIHEYAGRIINLHPSLLPKFGGRGMYGARVHRAVLDAGESESGCTIHLVDACTDGGAILLQRRVPVLAGDTVATLAARVQREEHLAIVEGVVRMVVRIEAML